MPSTRNPPSLDAPDRTSASLAIAGFLIVLATFMNANPAFGFHAVWPWQLFAEAQVSLLTKAVALVWMFTGLWVVVLSFAPAYRLRSVSSLTLGLVLITQLEGPFAGMTIERFQVNEFLALIGIGGGLLLARGTAFGSSATVRRIGGQIALISTLAFVLTWCVGFESGLPRFRIFLNDIDVALAGGDAYRGITKPDAGYPWHTLVPQALMIVSAIGALLVGLGLRTRTFVTVVLCVLIAAIALPLGVRIVRVLDGTNPEFEDIAAQLFESLVEDGIALWVLVAFAIGDLYRPDPADEAWEAA